MRVNFIVEDLSLFKYIGSTTAARMLYRALKGFPDLEVTWNSPEKDFDLVHYHSFGPFALWYKWRSGGLAVVTAHSTPRLNRQNLALAGVINSFYPPVYRSFDHIITISQGSSREVAEMAPDVPTTLIPNGVDRTLFHSDPEKRVRFRERYGIGKDDWVALTVAQQTPRKGILDFIELFRMRPELRGIWVGGFPYGVLSKSYWRIQNAKKECRENVIFTGFVPDITEAYSGADLFFMPSYAEGMSIVLLEALASGLPCVVRRIPEFEEVFGPEGLYFSTTDEAAEVVMEKERLRATAEKSREFSARFDIDLIARKHHRLYQELVHS
ncbi:MAG: glycosyltransferase family 4 protein [Methanomicrobiales archaeon]|nr:glycosyltransferase family 4 protein [Methanomicrobiales archaeon]